MNLDEFCDEMQKDIERFKANWKANQAKTPEHWPSEMPPGDWYDQLLMFLSQGDES